MLQICGVAKNLKNLNFGNIFTGNMIKHLKKQQDSLNKPTNLVSRCGSSTKH